MLNHGAIGNGRLLALVSPSTHIEWFCVPRFDSPSVFARLLDDEKGGSFGFEAVDLTESRMSYVVNTNVLCTQITTAEGSFDIYDYAPRVPAGLGVDAPLELHRVLVPRDGEPRVKAIFDPRPDYGRVVPEIVEVTGGLDVLGGPTSLHLRSNVPASYLANGLPFRLDETRYFILSAREPTKLDSPSAVEHVLHDTIDGWRAWAKTCAIPTFAPKAVLRSALCLKLHAYVETGAIIAAATTSIPEAPNSERTWDYRFCWLRDAAFVVEALRRLSHLSEGEAFVRFLRQVAENGPLQPVYGIGGERELVEEHLDHLKGCFGGKPVRIGNAAYVQNQHDLMGEVVLCLETILSDERIVVRDMQSIFTLVDQLVGQAIALFDVDDTGIWEYRTNPGPHTFSKMLCWVAARRGVALADATGHEDKAQEWGRWADEKQAFILERAYNAELGYFTQMLNGKYPDASLLLMPTFGIIDARDPRFVSTVRAYERLLAPNGLMYRYRHLDDFGETTSAFSICSFWWVEALAAMGELERAIEIFNRLLTHANPVGLFSEDLDPKTGELFGNFPQAYTHVGLIHAAITIGELLEARESRFRAWT